MAVVDLFAGPGGWSEGLRMLGMSDVGIEWDAAACRTRAAAGHLTVRADVAQYPPERFAGAEGLIASPPCTAFSAAGKGAGRDLLGELCAAVLAEDWGALRDHDPTVWLPLEVGRWVDATRPRWVACEQVPPAMPLWDAYRHVLGRWGYSVAAGVLNAADFGVPQTRKRAILVASLDRPARLPEPTHGRDPAPGLFGTLLPWVSMAQALGWDESYLVGFPRRADTPSNQATGTITLGDTDYRDRDMYPSDGPAQALTEKARSWQRWVTLRANAQANAATRAADEPAPTITASMDNGDTRWVVNTGRAWTLGGTRADAQTHDPAAGPAPSLTAKSGGQWTLRLHNQSGDDDGSWVVDRPATVVASRDLVQHPGATANRFNDSTKSRNDGIKITVAEALVLQSFRPDYPVQGSKTKQFEQVGNAVPPLLAAHVVAALTGRTIGAEAAA
jgi:DNA (cytosine-5)-methyltransferase 1